MKKIGKGKDEIEPVKNHPIDHVSQWIYEGGHELKTVTPDDVEIVEKAVIAMPFDDRIKIVLLSICRDLKLVWNKYTFSSQGLLPREFQARVMGEQLSAATRSNVGGQTLRCCECSKPISIGLELGGPPKIEKIPAQIETSKPPDQIDIDWEILPPEPPTKFGRPIPKLDMSGIRPEHLDRVFMDEFEKLQNRAAIDVTPEIMEVEQNGKDESKQEPTTD